MHTGREEEKEKECGRGVTEIFRGPAVLGENRRVTLGLAGHPLPGVRESEVLVDLNPWCHCRDWVLGWRMEIPGEIGGGNSN